MTQTPLLLAIIFLLVVLVLYIAAIKRIKKIQLELSDSNQKNEEYKSRFADYFNVEEECKKLIEKTEQECSIIKEESLKVKENANNELTNTIEKMDGINKQIQELRRTYKEKKEIYDKLVRQISIYSEDVELAELGFYEPHFNFEDSEQFKNKIKSIRDEQKLMLRDKTHSGAVYCTTQWTVEGSRAEGKKMTDRNIRLTTRAFNNECDAAISNCTWKNITKMEERITKAFEAINKLNEQNHIYINTKYLNKKLEELWLTHEYREQKQKEKEEQAEIRAQMREEERAQREIEKAMQDAEAEERRYKKAIEAARKEMEKVTGDMKQRLENRIAELEQSLSQAESKHQRALSMAQQTKQGHVYIISNIGSFGENVYKIGMTRRLDPQDRVNELGDASVPFIFDVHAMIYSEDAPSLEKKLHDVFDKKRVNLVNRRKEFFYVTLDEIKEAVKKHSDSEIEFIETAVAKDFNESLAIRNHENKKSDNSNSLIIPERKTPEFADAI